MGLRHIHWLPLASAALGIVLYIVGLGSLDYTIPDAAFGLAYWAACKLGFWAGGPSWVEQHRLLALVCFFGWPMALCIGYSYLLVSTFWDFWIDRGTSGRIQAVLLAALLLALPLLGGRTLEPVELSFREHADANY